MWQWPFVFQKHIAQACVGNIKDDLEDNPVKIDMLNTLIAYMLLLSPRIFILNYTWKKSILITYHFNYYISASY